MYTHVYYVCEMYTCMGCVNYVCGVYTCMYVCLGRMYSIYVVYTYLCIYGMYVLYMWSVHVYVCIYGTCIHYVCVYMGRVYTMYVMKQQSLLLCCWLAWSYVSPGCYLILFLFTYNNEYNFFRLYNFMLFKNL